MKDKCIFRDCDKSPKCRGLCGRHYSLLRYMVMNKKITWRQIELKGFARPPVTNSPEIKEQLYKDLGLVK